MPWIENINFLGGWRTTDANGRSVPLHSAFARDGEHLSAATLREILRRDGCKVASPARAFKVRLIALLLLLFSIFMCTRDYYFRPRMFRWSNIAGPLVIYGAVWAGSAYMFVPPHRYTRAMLRARRCPSCSYDLQARRAEPNGLTFCPECGAAWKLLRVECDKPTP